MPLVMSAEQYKVSACLCYRDTRCFFKIAFFIERMHLVSDAHCCFPKCMICRTSRRQVHGKLVRQEGNEFAIGRLFGGEGHGAAEGLVQGIHSAPVPGYFDGMADGALYPAGGGLECFRHLGVQYLGDGVGVLSARLGALPDAAGEPYKD